MKIITKYKQYYKLLEDKKPESILKNIRNGLEFFKTNIKNIAISNFPKKRIAEIKKIFNLDYLSKYYNRYEVNSIDFKICINFCEEDSFDYIDDALISFLVNHPGFPTSFMDYERPYLIKFYDHDDGTGKPIFYICNGEYGLKKCILYHVLNTEKFKNKIFTDYFLNLIRSKDKVNQLIEEADYSKVSWYQSSKYFEYCVNNKIIDFENIDECENIKYISNLYYLLEKGIISKEDFVNKNPNWFLLKDGKIYIKTPFTEVYELSFMFSENDSNRKRVERTENFDPYTEYTTDRFKDLNFSYLTPETIKLIEDKIYEIYNSLDEEDKEEFSNYDSWVEKVDNIVSLEDIKNVIKEEFDVAYSSANYDQRITDYEKDVSNYFGMKEILRDENANYLFLLDKKFLVYFDSYWYNESYTHNINFKIIEKWFEQYSSFHEDREYIKITKDEHFGDVDLDELNNNIKNNI